MRLKTLTYGDLMCAVLEAVQRRIEMLASGRAHGGRGTGDRSAWDCEIEGACAELAWCRTRGVKWTGRRGRGRCDSASGEEVRYTLRLGKGGLVIYPHDCGQRYVLLEGYAPHFVAVGWWRDAQAAKKPDWWSDATNSYIVPRKYLIPMAGDCLSECKAVQGVIDGL